MSVTAIAKKIRVRRPPTTAKGPVSSRRRGGSKSAKSVLASDPPVEVTVQHVDFDPESTTKVNLPGAVISRIIRIVNLNIKKIFAGRKRAIRRTAPATRAIGAAMIRRGVEVAIAAAATTSASTLTSTQVAKAEQLLRPPVRSALESETFGHVNVHAAGFGGIANAEVDNFAAETAYFEERFGRKDVVVEDVADADDDDADAAVDAPIALSQFVIPSSGVRDSDDI